MTDQFEKVDILNGQLRIRDVKNAAAEICSFFIGKDLLLCNHNRVYARLDSHMQLIKQDRLILLI
ncbi:MAG: hypothetical protein IKS42_04710 [Oscillospiraceae bacterium]|nr:hypothetical protein [Oscillospiraceae bacterium]